MTPTEIRRRITVVIELGEETEDDIPVLEALDEAMKNMVLNPGERYEVVSDDAF